MKIFYVYILLCADQTYYTGITSNLTERIIEHRNKKYSNSYTSSRLPVELVFYCEFTDPEFAIAKEKQIKKWSKIKKEALIDGKYDELPNLAKKKF
ncbi:MAG TPA: GIY-YIG nuclease family protein [Leeuwenhoekiella sp.]|nr:GIY-YIG nuclease family protein [Leeuwenhoekiella sp.]